ncbi:MAG TPA: hypothetical protein VGH28_04195 [Polyangiaceae bacterium]|jgi:hypothetical protein
MKRFLLVALLLGCGPTNFDDVIDMGDGGFGFDATFPRDASPFPDAADDAPKFNGGGPFLCSDCICDGTIDMCFFSGGGGGAPVLSDAGDDADANDDADASPFGDASACSPDAAASQCTQIPIQCLPNPTCACLEQTTFCSCTVDAIGSGFIVTCPPKP